MGKKKKSLLGIVSTKKFTLVKSKKGVAIIAVILLAAVFLLFSGSSTEEKKENLYFEEKIETEEYADTLEKRLESIISSISNAGKTEVMVTLSGSTHYIYQIDRKTSADNDLENGGIMKESASDEENTVIVKNSSGDEIPVLKHTSSPDIRGVLVICEGGERADVKENVSKAVKALLGISSNKICVLKKK